MELRGRLAVFTIFAIALGLSCTAWWHQYQQTDQAAAFWGREDAMLILSSTELELLTLRKTKRIDDSADSSRASVEHESNQLPTETTADLPVRGYQRTTVFDLSKAEGLVHFRHSLTYDDNYHWEKLTTSQSANFEARYALRFANEDDKLWLLFPAGFKQMARLNRDDSVSVLPCARMSDALLTYLRDVGALQRSLD